MYGSSVDYHLRCTDLCVTAVEDCNPSNQGQMFD